MWQKVTAQPQGAGNEIHEILQGNLLLLDTKTPIDVKDVIRKTFINKATIDNGVVMYYTLYSSPHAYVVNYFVSFMRLYVPDLVIESNKWIVSSSKIPEDSVLYYKFMEHCLLG